MLLSAWNPGQNSERLSNLADSEREADDNRGSSMTQRERHTSSGGATEAARHLDPSREMSPCADSAPEENNQLSLLWENVYRQASPAHRLELLSLAKQHRWLDAQARRSAVPKTLSAEENWQRLQRLLAGRSDDLAPIHASPVELQDTALDSFQRDAVAKALHTPDLCLICGSSGTEKSRVVAEIVTQAALRGQRVLLTAPSAAALDGVLEHLVGRDALCPIRCLEPQERPETLSPSLHGWTFTERRHQLGDRPLQGARQELADMEQRRRRHHREEPLWEKLRQILERYQALEAEIESLQKRRSSRAFAVEPEIEEAESSKGVVTEEREKHQKELANLNSELAGFRERQKKLRHEQDERAHRLECLGRLAESKRQGRWWTLGWWRATFRGNIATEIAALETDLQRIQAEREAADQEIHRLSHQREETVQAFDLEQRCLNKTAAAPRLTASNDEDATLQREQKSLQEAWQAACRELEDENHRPAAMTFEAIQRAQAAWRDQAESDEQQHCLLQQWIACLEEAAGSLVERLVHHATPVAATLAAWAADEHFGNQASQPASFDLLVVHEADGIAQSEFLALARQARRWIFVGKPDCERIGPYEATKANSSSPKPCFFHALWQSLHCDPRNLPYAWIQEKDRLCCRLLPLTQDQRQWLECERVADFPDVELRILAPPHVAPVLAEVVFPSSMSITQAKEYIYRELQELPVLTSASALCWIEEAEKLVLSFCHLCTPATDALGISLERGVREFLACTYRGSNGSVPISRLWSTCRLEFDRRAGWQRPQAEEWVRLHLGLRDLGRTAQLGM